MRHHQIDLRLNFGIKEKWIVWLFGMFFEYYSSLKRLTLIALVERSLRFGLWKTPFDRKTFEMESNSKCYFTAYRKLKLFTYGSFYTMSYRTCMWSPDIKPNLLCFYSEMLYFDSFKRKKSISSEATCNNSYKRKTTVTTWPNCQNLTQMLLSNPKASPTNQLLVSHKLFL